MTTSSKLDFGIYAVHVAFWGAFGLTLLVQRALERRPDVPESAPVAREKKTAPFSRALATLHAIAFGVMYFGLANAVLPGRVPEWFPGQRVVGACVIAAGSALMSWARVHFRSWRFRAKLDEGHQLATGGPFRHLRHPIYMGLNMLALGTAVWVPTPILWTGFVLMVLGSDLRARAEETLLEQAFGAPYSAYRKRTRRFVPGLY